MSRGMFGWDYPPGCTTLPGDEPQVCMVCGKLEDECKCPDCQECGEKGCLEHMPLNMLIMEQNRFHMLSTNYLSEIKRRFELKSQLCLICHKPITFEEFQLEEMPVHPQCREEI